MTFTPEDAADGFVILAATELLTRCADIVMTADAWAAFAAGALAVAAALFVEYYLTETRGEV